MLHILYFLIFSIFLFLIGRGFVILMHNIFKIQFNDKNEIFNIPIFYFYQLFGLFYIGNFSFIYNFISKNNSVKFYFFLFLILFLNLKNKLNINLDITNAINFVALPSILSFSSVTIGFAYDAGLYHLNTQQWIRESNVVFGLSNLHFRYGFSSILDYISSIFWINNNFDFLHFTNLAFISSFIGIISIAIIKKITPVLSMSSLSIVIFGILDNFGKGGGRNGFIDIESVTKQDTPFGIIFYISNIFIVYCIFKRKASDFEILTLSLLTVFGIQLRIFGSITLLFLIYLIFEIRNFKFRLFIPSFLLGVLWLLKNIFVSGCLLYPVEITCFGNLSWYNSESAFLEMAELKNFHIGYSIGTPIAEWFTLWSSKEINGNVLFNFFIAIIFLAILFLFFGKRNTIKINRRANTFIYVYLVFIICLWIVTSPGIRLGIGIFLFIIGMIGSRFESLKFNLQNYKTYMYLLIFMSTVLIPNIQNYTTVMKNPLIYNKISPAEVVYVPKDGYGVLPENGSQCWINIECVQNTKKIIYLEDGYYKLFKVEN